MSRKVIFELLAHDLACFLIIFGGVHEEGGLVGSGEVHLFFLALDGHAFSWGFEGETGLFAFRLLELHTRLSSAFDYFYLLLLWSTVECHFVLFELIPPSYFSLGYYFQCQFILLHSIENVVLI